MQIKDILIATLLIVNLWRLILTVIYSAARSMTQLNAYVAVSKKLLDNCESTSGYLIWLIEATLTVPVMFLLIICECIALFIEKFLISGRKKSRTVKRRKVKNNDI